jgi:hypothetical protein
VKSSCWASYNTKARQEAREKAKETSRNKRDVHFGSVV